MEVIATEKGYRQGAIIEPGTRFTLNAGERMGAWMTPAKVEDGIKQREVDADEQRKAARRQAAIRNRAKAQTKAAAAAATDPAPDELL